MDIRSVGPGLRAVIPTAVGRNLVDLFTLERPLSGFTWEDILHHTNNVFQLVARSTADHTEESANFNNSNDKDSALDDNQGDCNELHLKGQMMYMTEWDCIMFLGTPIMNSLDDMFRIGLYINDLSMHDSSRDLVLAGTQQSAELKLALDQEQEKSRLLEQSMVKLDQEMQRTDALLYQMIPKPVADRLRRGVPSVETCQVFENVTILFSDVVGFTTICSQITPMEVVSMLNAMYTQFDQLSENHSVYKVETIGDAYMAVSGAPTVTKYHALHMCDMALDMRASMKNLLNPSNHETMKIRIGIHTGTTVAGVVGIKMPRYCLFGDTVNTASRMETSGEAMKIHISETTRKELENYPYVVENRGSIDVKGKGQMKTYWLTGKKEISENDLPMCPFIGIMKEEVLRRNQEEHVDSYNSRLVTDQRYSVSPIPHPYSPVSFRDIDDRVSPTIRNCSRDLIDGDLPKLGVSLSPTSSRTAPVGCPFAMGFFSAPPSSESHKKLDNHHMVKKSSIDITYATMFESMKFSSNINYKPQCTPSYHNQVNGKKNEVVLKCDSNIQFQTTPSIPVSRDSVISVVTDAGLSPSHVAARNITTSKEKDGTSDLHFVGSSPKKFPFDKQKISSRQSSPEAISTYYTGNIDNASIIALDSRTSSAASQKVVDPPLNNNDGRYYKDTSAGNGSLGHRVAPLSHELDKFMPGKHGVANGAVVIKNEFGCLSGSCSDKQRTERKSKTCEIF